MNVLRMLAGNLIPIEWTDKKGLTALMTAASRGKTEAVKFLLELEENSLFVGKWFKISLM